MAIYDSALSAEVQATTTLPAPTLDTVTTDATGADLAWTATHTNGDTRVEYRDTDNTTWITDQTVGFATETATITGLDNGTTYDFRVVATTADADSPSNTLTDTTTLPDEDQPILGNGVKDEIAVNRETAVSNAGDVRYQLRRSEDAPDWETAPSFQEFVGSFDTLTFEFVGLLDGEEYEVRGRTETADATGAFTAPVSIVTTFPAITGLAASLDDATGDVTLTWTDNADNEDGIEVQRRELSTDSGTPSAWQVITTLPPDTETYTDNIDAGEYEYRLRAFTPYTDSFSDTTVTVLRPTQVGGVDGWQVVAANQIDPETNVAPRPVSAVYDVDPVVDTANPFGDYGVFKADDRGGEVFDRFPRGEQVEFYAPQETTPRLSGYVVERRENEQAGADALEVEVYSFDQFLRRNTVTNDQRGNTIAQALADIIQTDTPVSYVAGNVDVGDEQELTRSYQGEAVETVLRDFAFKSNNEEFGVNDALEFFFRPRETEHIDRGIDNTEWFRYDIPELGKEAINEVEVWFDGGEESVIVDDGTDKLDLQDNLGLPSPGTQRAELNRPLVTDIADAEDIGRKYLKFRNSTLSGTVTTFGLYDAEPGDTIDITIDSRGIDSEFVIAGVEYRWGVDETILTIIERRGDVDDILTDLNDSVQRVEMEGANRDAPSNRITTTNATALVDVSVDADGNTPDAVRFVNDGRRAVRDGWRGAGLPDVSTLVVGSDNAGLSRSNDTLRNQIASASVSQALPNATSVEFSTSVTQTGIQELGLETANGRLITRAVFSSPVDLDGTVTVTLGVDNDASVSRGVITTDGQTAVRDVLANNSPALPDRYAYGDDGSAVSESDAALGNELVDVSLEEILIQDAALSGEWDNITSNKTATDPLTTDNDELAVAQVCFTTEGEDFTNASGDVGISGDVYSDGQVRAVDTTGATIKWDFTPGYDIPAGELGIQVRDDDGGAGTGSDGIAAFEWRFNGDLVDENPTTGGNFVLGWSDIAAGFYSGVAWTSPALDAGTTYTISVECTDGGALGDQYGIDVLAPYDKRFESDLFFDDDNGGSGGYLDGPELFPSVVDVSFATATTRRNITEANFTSTWNDTSNNQYIELANDGSTFTRFNNADTGSVTFASPDKGVDTNIGLSRFGSRTTATPQQGFNGQAIQDWDLTANPDAVFTDDIGETLTRAVIAPGTIDGETVREAGLKHAATNTLLTRHELAEFTVESSQRISSAESSTFTGDE
ncbi:hypothetical protein OSG_eHP10_00030 [environmental Halophage eHP-10]|nr:hypothetical protein OSG_eHP10_00030 [environmental Halophage eHP-10]